MQEQSYYIYILTRKRNSTFYVGVTHDLLKRIYEHKNNLAEGFTKKYDVKQLVYYEHCEDTHAALEREKIIKKWKREYKISAIERMNPEWKDLYFDLLTEANQE